MDKNLIKEAESLFNSTGTDRRSFLKTGAAATVGLGYVAAAEPVLAQAIKTNFDGIDAQEVSFSSKGFDVPAYVARPKKAPKNGLPVVFVVSEIFGVHEYIADVARRFAKMGYLAIAPEFFVRAGDPNTIGTMAEILKEIVGKTPDDQVMADIQAGIDWAGPNGHGPCLCQKTQLPSLPSRQFN